MEKPAPVADIFVPSKVLEEVVRGSYEQVVEAVRDAVEQEKELFGEAGASLVATFSGYAFAATPGGKFFRVRFESNGRAARLQDATPMKIPIVTKDTVSSFVRKEARKVVDGFFQSGLTEETRNHLHDVASAIIGGLNVTPEGAAGFVVERVNSDRRWKQYVEDPGQDVIDFTDTDPKKFGPCIKPKFKAVLAGDYDVAKTDEYRTVAIGSVKDLADKIDEVAKLATDAANSTFTLKQEWRRVGTDLMVGDFREFVIDFADDVRGLSEELQSYLAVISEDRLESIASLHDAVAAKMNEVELAGVFVEKFANRFEVA